MKFSACWITKNEVDSLVKSIESVADIVDEIIVVDTGSTDDTVERVKELGAKVFHFEWIDDFSAARNYAIEQVTGDAIIFLDSDERFEPKLTDEDALKFEHILKESMQIIFPIHNILDAAKNVITVNKVSRIFSNRSDIRYVNKIHETLRLLSGGRFISVETTNVIIHTGYDKSIKKEKDARNIEMLEEEHYDDFRESGRLFYLMREQYSARNVDECFKYLDMFLQNKQHISNLLMHYPALRFDYIFITMNVITQNRKRINRRLVYNRLVKDIQKLFPDSPLSALAELLCTENLFNNEINYIEKINKHQKTLVAIDESIETSNKHITHTFFKAAAILLKLGMFEAAREFAILSVIDVDYDAQQKRIAVLLCAVKGMPELDIIQMLSVAVSKTSAGFLANVIESLIYEKYKNIYIFFLKKQLEAGKGTMSGIVYLYILLKQYDKALEMIDNIREKVAPAEISALILFVALCSDDKEVYEKYKEDLAKFDMMLRVFFYGEEPKDLNLQAFGILSNQYKFIAFAAGMETANRYLKCVKISPINEFNLKYSYYFGGGLFEEFLQDCKDVFPTFDNKSAYRTLLDCRIYAGKYEDAFPMVKQFLEADIIDYGIINTLSIIAMKTTGDAQKEANELYNKYSAILEESIDVDDVINTSITFDNTTKKELRNLKALTANGFKQLMSKTPVVEVEFMKEKLMNAAKIYMDNKMPGMAEGCYRRLLASGYNVSEVKECLASAYRALGNMKITDTVMKYQGL